MDFNKELSRLENIVSELKDETLDLKKALKLYDEGIKAYDICKKILSEAEQKIEVLSDDGGAKCQDMSIAD